MKRILVPLDGSLLSEHALPTAIALARRHEAALELFLVNEATSEGGLEGWPWALSTPRNHGDYIANRAKASSEATGQIVQHGVAEGRPANAICRRATEHDASLIVMTSRAHTGLKRILGGSVTDAVIRHAHVPVLLLPAAVQGRRVRDAALRLERILIAIDGSPLSFAALEAALMLADRGVTELHLVEVIAPVRLSTRNFVRRTVPFDRAATELAVDRVGDRLGAFAEGVATRSGCDVYPHIIINDDPARGILRVARGFNASLIAMGTHGRGASRMFVGSVAERVLGDGRYPMLIVRPPGAEATADHPLWEEPWAQDLPR